MIAHDRGFDPTRTETIIAALKILSRDIQSGDGVANAALREAAEHMQWLSDLLTRPKTVEPHAGESVNLRKAAEGQPCILCGDTATTVLHHVRSGGNGGMGKKPPDEHGIEVCRLHHAYFHSEGIADYRLALIAYQRQVTSWLKRGVFG